MKKLNVQRIGRPRKASPEGLPRVTVPIVSIVRVARGTEWSGPAFYNPATTCGSSDSGGVLVYTSNSWSVVGTVLICTAINGLIVKNRNQDRFMFWIECRSVLVRRDHQRVLFHSYPCWVRSSARASALWKQYISCACVGVAPSESVVRLGNNANDAATRNSLISISNLVWK